MGSNFNTRENAKLTFLVLDIFVYVLTFLFAIMVGFKNYMFFYSKGYFAFFVIYVLLFLFAGRMLDSFELGDTTTTDIFLSHSLTLLFTDFISYLILCLISSRLLPILPIVLMFIGQTFVAAFLLYRENHYIRATYPPVRVAVIYGEEHYGLIGKLNNIADLSMSVVKTVDVEKFDFDHFDEFLKDIDGIVTLDVHHENKKKIFKKCYENNLLVYDVPSITDMLLTSADMLHIVDTPILKINKFGPSPIEKMLKRAIDVVGSLVLIILTSPIMLATAIAIKMYDHGDILYSHVRLTEGKKEFKIVKFRSMIMNAEKNTGIVLARQNDDRITPVGKFIRMTRFDELPQLFNILKGEMSFVGPRPERPEIYKQICEDFPEFEYRLVVKAGLTGYAQIYGKYNTSLRDKLLLDLYYIENYSVLEDIKLLLLTLKIVFSKDSTEGVK